MLFQVIKRAHLLTNEVGVAYHPNVFYANFSILGEIGNNDDLSFLERVPEVVNGLHAVECVRVLTIGVGRVIGLSGIADVPASETSFVSSFLRHR